MLLNKGGIYRMCQPRKWSRTTSRSKKGADEIYGGKQKAIINRACQGFLLPKMRHGSFTHKRKPNPQVPYLIAHCVNRASQDHSHLCPQVPRNPATFAPPVYRHSYPT